MMAGEETLATRKRKAKERGYYKTYLKTGGKVPRNTLYNQRKKALKFHNETQDSDYSNESDQQNSDDGSVSYNEDLGSNYNNDVDKSGEDSVSNSSRPGSVSTESENASKQGNGSSKNESSVSNDSNDCNVYDKSPIASDDESESPDNKSVDSTLLQSSTNGDVPSDIDVNNEFSEDENSFESYSFETFSEDYCSDGDDIQYPPIENLNGPDSRRVAGFNDSDASSNFDNDDDDTVLANENNEDVIDHNVENLAINQICQEDAPIYENAEITLKEGQMLTITMSLTERFSDLNVENFIKVLDCHLPYEVYGSKHRLLKNVQSLSWIMYSYCVNCGIIIKIINKKIKLIKCSICCTEFEVKSLKRLDRIFYYIPLEQQLINIVKSPLYAEFRKVSDDNDVVSGSVYQTLRDDQTIRDNDISIQWNTDGVSLFKNSRASICPILVGINELPYRIRRNNILLCGLWYKNNSEYIPNIFLRPFVEELIKLRTVGFETPTFFSKESILIRVHCLFAPVDSVERPKLQNLHQFNGKYGCPYCLNPGVEIARRKGKARIYLGGIMTLRDELLHREHVKIAVDRDEIYFGVKGPSVVALIPGFNEIHSFPPEWMHLGVLGVVDLFIYIFFNSEFKEKPWYIGKKKKEFNEKLFKIKPCRELTKTPIDIGKPSCYTANDLAYFGLFYSVPCLTGILPGRYLRHWFLYCYAIYIFCKKKINPIEFDKASKALNEFVSQIPTLYGNEFMRFNIHLLLHMPSYVTRYGSLWAWSAFPFEHFNGIIKKLFYGTQCIPLQICKQYKRLQYVKSNSSMFDGDDCSPRAKQAFLSLMRKLKVKNCIEFGEKLKVFDVGAVKTLSVNEKILIQQTLQEEVEESACIYLRFLYNRIMFHSKNYLRMTKRDNSIVLTTNGDIITILYIARVTIKRTTSEHFVVVGQKFDILTDEHLCKNNSYSSNEICKVASVSNTMPLASFLPAALDNKCVKVFYTDDRCIIYPLPNLYERD